MILRYRLLAGTHREGSFGKPIIYRKERGKPGPVIKSERRLDRIFGKEKFGLLDRDPDKPVAKEEQLAVEVVLTGVKRDDGNGWDVINEATNLPINDMPLDKLTAAAMLRSVGKNLPDDPDEMLGDKGKDEPVPPPPVVDDDEDDEDEDDDEPEPKKLTRSKKKKGKKKGKKKSARSKTRNSRRKSRPKD